MVRRNDEITIDEIDNLDLDRIVISPGPCTPDKSGISLSVIQNYARSLPIFGVCLGHQAIAQAFGAKIIHSPRIMHGKTSSIFHDGKGVFQNLKIPLTVTRYHSLIIDPVTLPSCLEITSWTKKHEIMGIRHRKYHLEGVQFHPESVLSEEGHKLLANFLHF